MRFLTAQNLNTAGDQRNQRTAILNDSGSPRMTHISAKTIGGDPNVHIGVSNQGNSQPTMTDVTASASGNSSRNFGVQISGGSTTMTGVTATASGSRNPNTAVQIVGGSATIRQSKLSATGPGQNGAVDNDGENLAAVNCRSSASK